jgi:tRNA (guanine-N7-)-methyltransferase
MPDREAAGWRRKIYGRRKGKALRASQVRLLKELLPRLRVRGVPGSLDGSPIQAIDMKSLFGHARAVWLEIGFGGGEHVALQAAAHPEVGILACEPFVNGVAMLLGRLAAAGTENVRIHDGDARDLIEALPEAALDRVFLLYPDPWPKARHHRRRFMNSDNLDMLQRVMKPGAELRLATDIPDYAEHALKAVAQSPDFAVAPGSGPDWSVAWPDWPGTRYEAKALRQGRRPHYLTFVRR